MLKRIVLVAAAAAVALALAALAGASSLPPIGPLKPNQVKWVHGPPGPTAAPRQAGSIGS